MRKTILALLLGLFAGCATPRQEPIPLPPTIPLPPGMPSTAVPMRRMSVRAFAASSATVTAATSDTNSAFYGTVTKFGYMTDDGKKGVGIKMEWLNWPDDHSYAIQKSTNLVDWSDVVLSVPGGPSRLMNYDLNGHEFYRIKRVFTSQ